MSLDRAEVRRELEVKAKIDNLLSYMNANYSTEKLY